MVISFFVVVDSFSATANVIHPEPRRPIEGPTTHRILSIVTEADYPLPGGIKVRLAHRMEGREGYGKDHLSSGRFIVTIMQMQYR